MKKHIKNIVIAFFAFLVITATGGFSIYHHICHCAGEISASVFLEATCDNDQYASASSCCNEAEQHSCCLEKRPIESKHSCNSEDCCQTSMQFLKIYDFLQPEQEKPSLKPLFTASAIFFIDIAEDILTTPICHNFSSDLPPPDSGREIIIALHQLKLAHPTV